MVSALSRVVDLEPGLVGLYDALEENFPHFIAVIRPLLQKLVEYLASRLEFIGAIRGF